MKNDEGGCRITDAGNTYNDALSVIKDKGYKIFLLPDIREEYLGDYWAIKDNRDFIASDPLRLLGLISMWEKFGDNWLEVENNEDLDDLILSRALPDNESDFEKLTPDEFISFVNDYKIFFKAIHYEVEIRDDISRKALFIIIDTFNKLEEW